MIISRSAVTLPQAARPILSQPENGEFSGLLIPLIVGSGLLLGGGTIWQFHEKRRERSDYLKCIETYTTAPMELRCFASPSMNSASIPGG